MTAVKEKQYHLASAGKWVICPAKIQCRLGGEHISEERYQQMSKGSGFTDASQVFAAVEAKTAASKKKEAFNKDEWLAKKEAEIENLQQELATQVENLSKDENWLAYLNTVSKFHNYSWNNQLLIGLQKPDATMVAGFQKWKEMERNVKKGEKSIAILAPVVVNKDRVDTDGRTTTGPDGKPLKDKAVVGFKAVRVFDVSQTEGKELPQHPVLTETPPEGYKEDLEQAIKDSGFTISYEDLSGGKRGYTTKTGGNRVVVKKGLSHAEEVNVLAHELGHIAAGHLEHLDEYHTGHNGHRGRMEVEAESIAYSLARSNGMSPRAGEGSAPYVAGWSSVEQGVDTVKNAAQAVSKSVGKLLTSAKWRNLIA